MRRRPDTPNGLMEFLIVETALWAKEQGASELSLNFCALTGVASSARSWSITRSTAIVGAVRPSRMPSPSASMYWSM